MCTVHDGIPELARLSRLRKKSNQAQVGRRLERPKLSRASPYNRFSATQALRGEVGPKDMMAPARHQDPYAPGAGGHACSMIEPNESQHREGGAAALISTRDSMMHGHNMFSRRYLHSRTDARSAANTGIIYYQWNLGKQGGRYGATFPAALLQAQARSQRH
jgi:hypothetical protein